MQFKKAEDLMIPLKDYPHVPIWYSLIETMKVMEQYEIETDGRKSLPRVVLAFDLDSSLCGIVRRRDIMRGLEPEYLANKPLEYSKKLFDIEVDANLTDLSYDRIIARFADRASQIVVSDVMIPVKVTVDHEDNILKIIYEMVNNNRSLIPVLKEKKVIGVVRSVEIYRELTKIILTKKNQN